MLQESPHLNVHLLVPYHIAIRAQSSVGCQYAKTVICRDRLQLPRLIDQPSLKLHDMQLAVQLLAM